MGKLSVANLRKTIYYLRRNGLENTWHAIRERMAKTEEYIYQAPTEAELSRQRSIAPDEQISFSIIVPTYRTVPWYLKELVDSVTAQTYSEWELILADATEDDSVERKAAELKAEAGAAGGKIRYVRLSGNAGISGNTNEALAYAEKEYIGLLDHDDLLTPDALFEMADAIKNAAQGGTNLKLVYSDEDKCDSDAKVFYEPNCKEDFNYDLILSNNYICHFLVMKRELMQKLRFRTAYDGAQDYDLVLRAVAELGILEDPDREKLIGHVPKVLYHWRCHSASTAENPRSKEYAYEAGRRALQAHLDQCGMEGRALPLKHVGFYEADYPGGIFACRKDLGAVGGPVFQRGRIIGGRMDQSGKVYYEGLPKGFSGYLNRAVLTQDAEAVDIRNIRIREELQGLFEEIVGVPYRCRENDRVFDATRLPENADYRELSLALCKAIRERGYRIQWRRENG